MLLQALRKRLTVAPALNRAFRIRKKSLFRRVFATTPTTGERLVSSFQDGGKPCKNAGFVRISA